MSRSSARRRVAAPVAALVPALVPALALVLLALLAGCSSGGDAEPSAPPPTAFADLDAGEVELPRIEFCQLVPDEVLDVALPGAPSDERSWAPGDEVDGERVQETGCEWRSGETRARAWVFARPLSQDQARRVAARSAVDGCRRETGTMVGTPSATDVCPARRDSERAMVRQAGLFGDTWLTCELRGPRAEVGRDAEPWCVRLADSLDTSG